MQEADDFSVLAALTALLMFGAFFALMLLSLVWPRVMEYHWYRASVKASILGLVMFGWGMIAAILVGRFYTWLYSSI